MSGLSLFNLMRHATFEKRLSALRTTSFQCGRMAKSRPCAG
jgi:hypothetical protein